MPWSVPDVMSIRPSAHPYHPAPAPLAYPAHFLQRRVTSAGLIWWHQEDVYLSQALAGFTVGLDPLTSTQHDVYFAEYLLGTMDLQHLRFTPLTQSRTSPINPV